MLNQKQTRYSVQTHASVAAAQKTSDRSSDSRSSRGDTAEQATMTMIDQFGSKLLTVDQVTSAAWLLLIADV